jgi:hypothetical protein
VTASDPPGALPNLLIAGVAKAGTTSLFRYLAQHPDVCPSDLKELRYFSALFYGEPLGPLDDYRKHFAHCGPARYRMEGTPGYYSGGRRVADAVNDLLPEARVIVCFRNPVERCWSWFGFQRSRGRVPKDMTFTEYLDRCEELRRESTDDTREGQPFWGMRGGCYDLWIDSWLEVLRERLHVVFFERLARDPRGVVEELCGWLDIDRAVCSTFRYDVENRTVQYRNKQLQRGAVALNRRGERLFAAHPRLKRNLRTAYYWLNSETNGYRLDARDRERLEAFYAPHNERLATALATAGVVDGPDWLRLSHRA